MSLIDLLGWLAAGVGVATSIPQLVRLIRSRTSAGLSLLMWQLQTGALIAFTVHGFRLGFMNVALPNVASIIGGVLVMRMIASDRRLTALAVTWPILVVALPLSVVEFVAPAFLFGSLVVIPLAVGLLSQSVGLVREPDISGVSLLMLVLIWATQLLWWSWSFLAGDAAILVSATVLGVITSFNLVWYGVRHLRANTR